MRRLMGGLHELGWNLSLVTTGQPKPHPPYHSFSSYLILPRPFQRHRGIAADKAHDSSQAEPRSARIAKLRTLRDSLAFSLRRLPIPRKSGWLAWYSKILGWAKAQRVDVIYSKSQPHSSHMLGRFLSQNLGVPWVAELGDLWSQNPYYKGPKLWSRVESALERWALKLAQGLVTVSTPMADQLSGMHNKKIKVIYNCFPQDSAEPPPMDESYELGLPLRILYAGRVYPKYRMPEILFEAILKLQEKGAIGPNDLAIDFLCSNHGWMARWMQRNYPTLASSCSINPPVPMEEALRRQRQSHLLLTIGWFGEGHEGVVTSKFFEYLGSGRKMLCIIKAGGELESIGQRIPGVELVRNVDEAREAVMKLLEAARKGQTITLPRDYWEKVSPYSCKEQAKRLSDFLKGFIQPS
jgi:hypothetical protein